MPDRRIKVFFDGGLRAGTDGMETAVVLHGQAHIARNLGPGTSADAEWLALIAAAQLARDAGLSDVALLGDCLSVIAQASGTMKCRGQYLAHCDAYRALLSTGLRPRVRYIKRTQNLAGIALARLHDR